MLKRALDLLAVTAGPQPHSRAYLGPVPATTALGQLLVNAADNPGAVVFSDYLVTEHGWNKDLANDAGVLLSSAVSREQDKSYVETLQHLLLVRLAIGTSKRGQPFDHATNPQCTNNQILPSNVVRQANPHS